jgi:tetratricopeptide (TPR) repeat protein
LIGIRPDDAGAHRNLGIVRLDLAQFDEALADYARAFRIKPDYAEAYSDLGNAMRRIGRFDEALGHYDKALAIKPDYAEVHHSRGVVLKTLGRIEAARRAFEAAIQFAPPRAEFYASLAMVTRFVDGDRHLAAMEKLARNIVALTRDTQIELHFALAAALSDLGQYARSFRHLADGNQLKRPQLSYDEAEILNRFDRVRALFTPELMHEHRGFGHPSSVPVFIIGMPRSGTTLVEQILASHPQVFGAGELSAFYDAVRRGAQEADLQPYPEIISSMTGRRLFQLGADYIESVSGLARSAERITDKLPGNFAAAGLIHLALPNARMIHVRRNPIDTCFSCFSTLFAEDQPHLYDFGELGRYYRAYAALMEHWYEVLPEGVMLEVRYGTLVADFEQQARRIVAHCGLGWDEACLAFYKTERPVRTASAVQVRQPIYRSAVGRWRPYRDMLGPLFAALEIEPPDP